MNKYYSLASGSSGNCTVIVAEGNMIMVDIGISYKDIEARMGLLGLEFSNISAFLLTHDHSDHIKSIQFADYKRRYAGFGTCEITMSNALEPFKEYLIAGFEVTPIPLSHDAINALGFVIKYKGEILVYITDTGYVHRNFSKLISNADYYLFESNYDPIMLLQSNRPDYLKKRIMSSEGHLSNDDASAILCNLIGDNTKEITLIHLSEEANTPKKAIDSLHIVAKEKNIDISRIKIRAAERHSITEGGIENEEKVV